MGSSAYDVIVVGARVAGAAMAMLLARAGLQVLLLDRARFPSDAVSSHQIQVPGVALLEQWGYWCHCSRPARRRRRVSSSTSTASCALGPLPLGRAVNAVCSPRRHLLDAVLVDAARAAGAEVREDAALVVGADGKHSTVARLAGARSHRTRPSQTFASYAYFSGMEMGGTARMYTRPGLAEAAFPTNDDLSVVFLSQSRQGFEQYRCGIPAGFLEAAARAGDLGERLSGGRIVERIRTTPDLPHHLITACGPGWVLAGDAGAVMDPITARGITHALKDADRLARAGRSRRRGLHRRHALARLDDPVGRRPSSRPDRPAPSRHPAAAGVMNRARAAVGTLAFLCLAPGTVAGLIPRWITGWQFSSTPPWWVVAQVVAVTMIAAALTALVAEFTRFALQGIGTPAPVAPTPHLVVHGLYRFVRNPMYLCVGALLLGQTLLFASLPLLTYTVVAALVMAAFARWYEEPHLAARFGAEYEQYRHRTPGWVPRPRGARP